MTHINLLLLLYLLRNRMAIELSAQCSMSPLNGMEVDFEILFMASGEMFLEIVPQEGLHGQIGSISIEIITMLNVTLSRPGG